MTLFAWVGADEYGGGRVGLKQGQVPAGIVPLVVIETDRHKLEAPALVAQLQAQATRFGMSIRLVRFEDVSVVRELEP